HRRRRRRRHRREPRRSLTLSTPASTGSAVALPLLLALALVLLALGAGLARLPGRALGRGLELIEPLAERAGQRAQLADLVAQPPHVVGERGALLQIADHLAGAAAQPAVELAIDQAAERIDRRRIADHGERLDGGGLDAEVAVREHQLEPLADVAGLAI